MILDLQKRCKNNTEYSHIPASVNVNVFVKTKKLTLVYYY